MQPSFGVTHKIMSLHCEPLSSEIRKAQNEEFTARYNKLAEVLHIFLRNIQVAGNLGTSRFQSAR